MLIHSAFNTTSVVIIGCFITSYDAHLFHCAYKNVVCTVFNIMLRVLVFYQSIFTIRRDDESSSVRKLAMNKRI